MTNSSDFPTARRSRSTKRAAADAVRSKTTYDLGHEIPDRVSAIAQALGCSQSDIAAHLLAAGLRVYASGQLELRSLRTPHTCKLRFAFKLSAPQLPRVREEPEA